MKLFELFESPILGGANNLKNIAQAATSGGDAEITLGNEPVTLEHPEARFIYGLYKRALQNGQQEQFMQALADPVGFHKLMQPMANMINRDRGPEMAQAAAQRIGQPGMGESAGMRMMENTETFAHITNRFKHEVKNFMNGHDLSDDLYHALYDYYSDHGEMPYGVQKARDGDPYEWVHMRFDQDVHDYAGGGNPDIPALPTATMPSMPRQESMYEAKNPWLNLAYDDTPRVGQRKRTSSGEVEYTGGGQIHRSTKRYGGDDPENVKDKDPVGNDGQPAVKRSKGRPSAAIQSSETGEQISDYKLWYHKSKRKHPERKIVGSSSNAIAVIPKGKKYLVVSKWEDGSGILLDTPNEILSVDDLQAFKSAKGRPKKIREWIETLRFVSEGETTKTATGIKHTAKDKYGAGETGTEKYSRDIDHLDKNLTSKLDKSMGIKHDHGNKKK